MTDLDELDRLRAGASKLPWRQGAVEKYNVFARDPDSLAGPVCGERVVLRVNQHFAGHEADAAFIVAACNANEELVAAVRRLTLANKQQLDRARNALASEGAHESWCYAKGRCDYCDVIEELIGDEAFNAIWETHYPWREHRKKVADALKETL